MNLMIGFNGIDYGNLFGYGLSGLGKPKYSSLSGISGINPASFSKILKSQHNMTAKHSTAAGNTRYGNNTARYGNNPVLQLGTEASKLAVSAKKMVSESSNNIFQNRDTYDPDKAYEAVKDFVNSYNDTVSALSQTGSYTTKSIGSSMMRMTEIMKESLSLAGVNVSSNGKLSIDEEAFKKADMDTVKSLFGGDNSYAKAVSSSAEGITSAAVLEQRRNIDQFYGSSGSLYNSLYSGFGFNSFF